MLMANMEGCSQMNKMAIFVEGYTELEFVGKLILEVADVNSITIEKRQIRGGTTCPRRAKLIQAHRPGQPHSHFFLIFDCGNDNLVKSRMIEEYPNLVSAGYSKILCQRDVYPDFTLSDLPRLERGLPIKVKTNPIVVTFILSVMEIEAWFLAEHTHFGRIDPGITVPAIIANCGFDPVNDDMQQRPHPAADLEACYAIAGKNYTKQTSANTIAAIDYNEVYFSVVNRFPHLKLMCDEITGFLDA
jgi:hypothetical protein